MSSFKLFVCVTLATLGAAKKHPTLPTTPCTNTPTSSCASTMCSDMINECGQTYGGCFPDCPGYPTPTFTDPGCPPTITSSSTLSVSSTCQQTLCVDYINDCGQMYGGCFANCPGYTTPSFSEPPCPTTRKPCSKTKCVDFINDCGLTCIS